MGNIYGGQTAGVSWKNHRTHVLVVKGGFIECKNMESIYYHPGRGIKMAIHVDDPTWMIVDALHILALDEPTFNHKDMSPMVLP